MAENDAPKIQIDADWKAEGQREKQRLASPAPGRASSGGTAADKGASSSSGGSSGATSGSGGGGGGGGRDGFQTLLSTMVTQALFAMGAIPDPATGQRMAHLELARHHIDMLAVIEEKTKGNLTQQESDTLATTLYELRNQYVHLAAAARKQAMAEAAAADQSQAKK